MDSEFVKGMIPEPTPWQTYRPGLFRLAGFGGALVLLRSGVGSGDPPVLTLDVGFLTPSDYVWSLRRPMRRELSAELARFFYGCASDIRPELTVEAVHDGVSALDIRALSSTDDRVEVEFQLPGDDDEGEGVNFLTTRVALAQAAQDVEVLQTPVGSYPDDPFAVDW